MSGPKLNTAFCCGYSNACTVVCCGYLTSIQKV